MAAASQIFDHNVFISSFGPLPFSAADDFSGDGPLPDLLFDPDPDLDFSIDDFFSVNVDLHGFSDTACLPADGDRSSDQGSESSSPARSASSADRDPSGSQSGNASSDQGVSPCESSDLKVASGEDGSRPWAAKRKRRGEDAGGDGEEEKRQARLIRNRESAQLSRQRRKHYMEELEDKVRTMHSTIAELNSRMSSVMAENASLRQQLAGGGAAGICQPTPLGVYPPPMQFPWVPCSYYYALKPHGTQVPLVPIPRLKPQKPYSAAKSNKADNKKAPSKTKKVASVSFVGLLFLLLFVGFVSFGYDGDQMAVLGGFGSGKSGLHGFKSQPRVMAVSGHYNVSDDWSGSGWYANDIGCGKGEHGGIDGDRRGARDGKGCGNSRHAREPLAASLYVPRNDKLVKIDGNLIIHSVLASEKAVESKHAPSSMKGSKSSHTSSEGAKISLAIANNMASALAVSNSGRDMERNSHMYGGVNERPKAIVSGTGKGYGDNLKASASDGVLQQWFREGLAGPVLSSGLCSEVFQFEVSPTSASNSGAIIPVASVANASNERSTDSARHSKIKNRRILYHSPIPLAGSSSNETGGTAEAPKNGSFHGNKSSMIVSVLVDPREAGDWDGDQVITLKSLPRIFVVVLLDSVKYVTYSCVLPLKSSGPHLVTT